MKAPHVDVQLVSQSQSVQPGGDLSVGFYFQLQKDWHIYWLNPGDSGQEARVTWTLPTGAQAGSILWPAPKRIQFGPLVNYGYENEVLLPVQIHVDPKFSGSNLPLKANLRWLVCSDICVPGKATLDLTLPVSASAPVADPKWSSDFEATSKMIPKEAPASWKLGGISKDHLFQVSIDGISNSSDQISFFPTTTDQIDNAVSAKIKADPSAVNFEFKHSERLAGDIDTLQGVVVTGNARGETEAFKVAFPLRGGFHEVTHPFTHTVVSGGFFLPIVSAFIGGLILNLMPCVFPVLSIKVMSVLKMAGGNRTRVRRQGLLYTAGVLVSFWVLVSILLALRFGGQQIGWGFQLQSPRFITALACVLFAFGLNLLGVFEISGRFMGVGSTLANREGGAGSFFTGVLATVVATPCSAPFMGSAIGFALTQSTPIVFSIFTSLALGLAVPYLAVCYAPSLAKILPKPGAWMETFRQLMAFLIFATVIWLAWVLGFQVSSSGLIILLSAFLGIGFAAWLLNRPAGRTALHWIAILIGFVVMIAATVVIGKIPPAGASALGGSSESGLNWEKYSPEKIAEYRAEGKPIFVDFTAAWCVSCQVNELLVFHSQEVRAKLKELGVALLKADWTNQDPVITQALAQFGRDGVPFYVIYGKGKDAPVTPLPEVISAGIVLTELEKIK
jgi:thiol:disulfide interchange protein DsbD